MRQPPGPGPFGWGQSVAAGLYRSAVLVGLTVVMPVIAGAVAYSGTRFALSWSSALHSPVILKVLADVGEVAMGLTWTAAAVWLSPVWAGKPLSQAARRLTCHWARIRIEAGYGPAPTVTRMATGYWWNGYEYYKSEAEARRRGKIDARARDPQVRWDGLWFAIAVVTVLPVAAIPLIGLAGGIYLAIMPGLAIPGTAAIVAGLAIAPFAWRILGVVGPRYLGSSAGRRLGRRPLGQRVEELESVRASLTQAQSAELDRIERGLHDGAQARLVALGLSMGAAEQLVDTDPATAKAMLADARMSSAAALAELRSLVRGINPPVLAERGLADAVRALALDAPVETTVVCNVPSRPERPLESAVYFDVAELMTKRSQARPRQSHKRRPRL